MTAEDLAQLGLLGNNVAMQWYILSHPGAQYPAPAPAASVSLPGVQASINTNYLILGLVAVAAIIILH